MGHLFTSESVSEGHPDKIADQISDAILDEVLRRDPESKVASETLVTTGLVLCSGELRTQAYIDLQDIVRRVIHKIGYNKAEYGFDANSCAVMSTLHEQSNDIYQGVSRKDPELQGAGDQGIMFGYACLETDDFMPLSIELSHRILKELSDIRKSGKKMKYLRPDAKSQVTLAFDTKGRVLRIDTVLISTQHDDFDTEENMQRIIKNDIEMILIPSLKKKLTAGVRRLFTKNTKLIVNPTGKFVVGGPNGDTGLTGRKIIVDTYGGNAPHGGGAFSGKDSSKVDRSAAYVARYIAKNLVAAGIADRVCIQLAYAIGIADPVSIHVNTFDTCKVKSIDGKIVKDNIISEKIRDVFPLTPYKIVKAFGLKNPIFEPTATYGHFGRTPYKKEVEVFYEDSESYKRDGKIYKNVEFYGWERLDKVEELKSIFNL